MTQSFKLVLYCQNFSALSCSITVQYVDIQYVGVRESGSLSRQEREYNPVSSYSTTSHNQPERDHCYSCTWLKNSTGNLISSMQKKNVCLLTNEFHYLHLCFLYCHHMRKGF